MKKLFIVRKYVMAESAQDALRKEKNIKPDDVWIDEEWKKMNEGKLKTPFGFNK